MTEMPDSRKVDPLLRELLSRAVVASRLRSASEGRLLASILESAVALFRAGAASIALVVGDHSRIEFVAAAGAQAKGVVGRSIGIGEGLAGYVVQTGEAIAIAHPTDDPRFGRSLAERTGFVPNSILAAPLRTPDSVVGVIEILDCRDGAFTSNDLALASIFARQAAIAIDSTRVEREFPILLANALASYGLELTDELRDAVASLPQQSPDDFWRLVDEIAGLQDASPEMRAFILELLPVARRHIGERRDRIRDDDLD
jgi:GAF domain-containing protein